MAAAVSTSASLRLFHLLTIILSFRNLMRTGRRLRPYASAGGQPIHASIAAKGIGVAWPVLLPTRRCSGHAASLAAPQQHPSSSSGVLPVLLRLNRPCQPGERVGVVGSVPELSNWDTNSVAVLMTYLHKEPDPDGWDEWPDYQPSWYCWCRMPAGQDVEFKFVLVDGKNGHAFKSWINDLEGYGSQNLRLKVEEGTVLDTKDVYARVHSERQLVFAGMPKSDKVRKGIEELSPEERARLRAELEQAIAENKKLIALREQLRL